MERPLHAFGLTLMERFLSGVMTAFGWLLMEFAVVAAVFDDTFGTQGFAGGILVAATFITGPVLILGSAGLRQNRAALELAFGLLIAIAAAWLVRGIVDFTVGAIATGAALGALFAVSVSLLADGRPVPVGLSAGGWLALIALGAVATGAAFVAFAWIVRQAGSVRASTVTYIVPVFGLLSGWIALGEDLSPTIGAGALLILTGVALAGGRPASAVQLRPLHRYQCRLCEPPAMAR